MTTSGFLGFMDPTQKLREADFAAGNLPRPVCCGTDFWRHAWPDAEQEIEDRPQASACLLFHGELYNLPALRQQLDAAGLPIAQVLMRAYQRWRAELSRHLDGIYVLAVRDDRSVRLFRDLSGARNLYYTTLPGGRFAFATHLETLLRLPGVERRLARQSLHEYLRFLDIAAPNTLYQGILALEAGKRLTWVVGQPCRVQPIDAPLPIPAPDSFEAAQESLEGLLRRSIDQRLAGSNRPAAFLSGGVDSALICALAAGVRPETTAVTVGFAGARFDETPIAARIAAHLGLPHQILRYGRADFLRALTEFQTGAEQPVGDPAVPPTLLAFQDCRTRFDAVLDGSGADESLGLMPPRHVRIAVEYAALLPGALRRASAGLLARIPGLRGYTPIFDFEHPAERMIRWGGFTRAEIARLCGEPVDFAHTRFFQTFAAYPRQAHFQRYTALLDAMPGDRLHEGARLTGLALRFPYWEASLDAYIRSLPIPYRYQPGNPKNLLRALLARHVPRAMWDIPKHGFDFPLLDFLRAEECSLVKRYLMQSPWREWQLLSVEEVETCARRFMAGETRLLFRVWALIVLAAWLENHTWRH